MRRILGAAILGLVALSATAEAAPLLTFDQVVTTGTVSYGGTVGTDPLVGTGINFESITGTGTAANSGVTLLCSSCILTFTTGAATAENVGFTTFAGGGSFSLSGTVTFLGANGVLGGGDDQVLINNTNILAGSFTGPNIATNTGVGTLQTVNFTANGIDTKNPALLAFYGIVDPNFTFAQSELSLASATVNADGSFTGAVTNADINNTSNPVVPEPASILLLGGGLTGLAGAIRRRRAAARV